MCVVLIFAMQLTENKDGNNFQWFDKFVLDLHILCDLPENQGLSGTGLLGSDAPGRRNSPAWFIRSTPHGRIAGKGSHLWGQSLTSHGSRTNTAFHEAIAYEGCYRPLLTYRPYLSLTLANLRFLQCSCGFGVESYS